MDRSSLDRTELASQAVHLAWEKQLHDRKRQTGRTASELRFGRRLRRRGFEHSHHTCSDQLADTLKLADSTAIRSPEPIMRPAPPATAGASGDADRSHSWRKLQLSRRPPEESTAALRLAAAAGQRMGEEPCARWTQQAGYGASRAEEQLQRRANFALGLRSAFRRSLSRVQNPSLAASGRKCLRDDHARAVAESASLARVGGRRFCGEARREAQRCVDR